MHGDVRGLAVLQANLGLADFFDLIGGKKPHSVHQRKFGHGNTIVSSRPTMTKVFVDNDEDFRHNAAYGIQAAPPHRR